MSITLDDLDVARFSGVIRVARKPWRCCCADPLWRIEVQFNWTGTSARGWSTIRFDADTPRDEIIAVAEAKIGQVAARNMNAGGVPSAWYESYEIVEVANPNYREGCLVDIHPGDRHVEYRGEAAAPWEAGPRYCEPCAVTAWARYLRGAQR